MDFKDYINGLSDLDYQEAKAKLTTFYTINSATFKFFKAIDSIVQDLLKQANINETALPQLENILPILVKLRSEILEIDSQSFAKGYKVKISNSIHYIQDIMTTNEVQDRAQSFFKLLEDNKKAFLIEQKKKEEDEKQKRELERIATETRTRVENENKIRTVAEAEKFFFETERKEGDAIDYCQLKTLKLLAEKSANSTILQTITDYILEPEGLMSCDEEDLWKNGEYIPYILMKCLYRNPKLPAYLHQKLDAESLTIKLEVAENSQTDLSTLTKLANDNVLYVSQIAKANPNYINLNNNIPNTNEPTSKSGCFIATACYGDYNAPEVLILRRYRDEYLLTNWLGTLFVKFYYAVSPSLAKHIEKTTLIKRIIRNNFLRPIVENIKQKYHN